MEDHTNKPKSPATPPTALPWKTRIVISLVSTVTDYSRRSDGTVNRRLLNFLDIRAPPNPNPINGVKTADVTVEPSRNLWFRIFVPTNDDAAAAVDLPVIVFFHGGGFVYLTADNRSYDAVCRRFARKVPAVVVSVNYRLAPEHRYPAQYDDCFDVVKFLDEDGVRRDVLPGNADLSSCFLAGDSAGANIAHHVAKRACEAKFAQLKVTGLVSIQPFFGGEERTEAENRLVGSHLVTVARTDWMWRAFLPPPDGSGAVMNRDHEAINVSGPRAVDLSALDFPATMVVVGGLDPLQDWQRRYYDWLKRCGKEAYLLEYPTMIHAFYVFPELPQSGQFISEVKDFIHKHRGGHVKCVSSI